MASSQPKIKAWKPYVPENGKLRLVDPSAPRETNDIASAVIAHLTGRQQTRPRKKTAVNVWRKTQRHNIEARVKNLMHAQGIVKDRMAAVRDKVAREMFNALPPSVQEKRKEEAKRETGLDIQEWERLQTDGPSTSPADRQMCIQGLARTMQLVLNYLSKTTGWNFTVLGGGPEPARNGKFSLMSVHSGLTSGEGKQNFRESESADYDKVIVPFFERLLKETFSSDDRRACALDNNEDFLPLNEADLKLYGASLDLFEDDDTLEPFEPPHVDPEPEIQSSTRPHAEEPEPIFPNQNPRASNSPKAQPGPAPTPSTSEIAPILPPELAISHHLLEDNSAPETAMASQVSPQTTGFATSFERWQEPIVAPAQALSDAPTHGPTYRVISTSSKDAAIPTIFPMRTLRSIQDAELNSPAAESSIASSLTHSSPEVDPCSSGLSSSEDPALKERLPGV